MIGSIDTNVLLRLILNDIPYLHKKALKLFETNTGQFGISDIALVEVIFVLQKHYGFTRAQIVEVMESLMLNVRINCNRAMLSKALPWFKENEALSFEDCAMTAYAELTNAAPLWTFDSKLAKRLPGAKLVKA